MKDLKKPDLTAPEIILKDSLGSVTRLSEITGDYFLIVFWASTCSHCSKMLPELSDLYSKMDNNYIKVLAFSLDTDKKKWSDFLSHGNYRWMNYNDTLGWQSNAASDYNVSATPMLFLLNKGKVIISKPEDLTELTVKLRSLNILRFAAIASRNASSLNPLW